VLSETKRESRLLDKVLKAAHNSASVLITAQRSKQRFVRDKFFKNQQPISVGV
jgi:hypothetical protein